MLPFGSIVAAHRPLDTQTALGGCSQEAVFVGIAPQFAAGILLFKPVTKRCFICHSFKYLSDIEPISASYVVTESTSADEKILIGPISDSNASIISSSIQPITGDPLKQNTHI